MKIISNQLRKVIRQPIIRERIAILPLQSSNILKNSHHLTRGDNITHNRQRFPIILLRLTDDFPHSRTGGRDGIDERRPKIFRKIYGEDE